MFSPNMLKTFQSCPQKYWFKYIKKISTPQKASNFEKGKKIHALANYYLKGDDVSKLETTLTDEEMKLWKLLKNNEYFQKVYVASEYDLLCKVDKYWIGGRIDAVVKDDESFYILDYKTGSIPKNPEYDFQTMVYLLCIANHIISLREDRNLRFRGEVNFVYIDLKNNQNHIISFSKEKAAEYEKRITEICKQIENYLPPENLEHLKKCEFCEYRKICI